MLTRNTLQHFGLQKRLIFQDYQDFCQLSDDEQYFIKNILAFFAASDTIVNINLSESLHKKYKFWKLYIFGNFKRQWKIVTVIPTFCKLKH